MKKLFFLMMVGLLAISGTLVSAQENDLPTLDELGEGWNELRPGGETICSNGTDYAFYVRPGDSDKLLIYFNGGGACWFGPICDLQVNPTYVPNVETDHNNPATHVGIFELDNPENPFADWSMVFVSYCTADVHIGDAVVTYDVPATGNMEAHQVTIHHKGYVNAMSALDWTFANYEAPRQIFVTGSSAGAIASPFYAGLVAEQYPDAQIVQLGDAAGGYHGEEVEAPLSAWNTISILPDWPEYAEVTADGLSFEDLYVATAMHTDNVVMAQYNTAEDETQYGFLFLVGISDPLPQLLDEAYQTIESQSGEELYTYTAGGDLHTILRRPEFYTYEVDGVRFVDWVASLVAGEDVGDVMCDVCDVAPNAP